MHVVNVSKSIKKISINNHVKHEKLNSFMHNKKFLPFARTNLKLKLTP